MPRAQKILDYNRMKAVELKKLCEQRDIQCKPLVKEMIEALKLEEQGKWVFHIEQEKLKKGGYIIKIDYRSREHLIRMGQLVDKKIARKMDIYSMYRLWYRMDEEFIKS